MSASTDKGMNGYMPLYHDIVDYLGPAARVVELGVYQGGSLKLWQQLFPESPAIVGVDNDTTARWPPGTVRVLADQADPELRHQLSAISPEYDLIVDDASHLGQLTYQSFANLWPLIRPGGLYVIEDWQVGFPDWTGHDDSMRTMARNLLDLLAQPMAETRHINYSHGQIVIQRKTDEELAQVWHPWREPGRYILRRP